MNSEHPTPDILRRLVEGRLDGPEFSTVEQHVESCASVCQPLLDQLAKESRAVTTTIANDEPSPTIPGYADFVEVGRGGMGVVYQALHIALNRPVAVKVLKAGLPQEKSAALATRFGKEAQITGQLQHPGVPPVHDLGATEDGRSYMVMRLIRGQTLAERFREGRAKGEPTGVLIGLFEKVCDAVAYAHSRGIVHRDLKPQNVMVGAFGAVSVLDWGLAKRLESGEPDPGAEDDRECESRTNVETAPEFDSHTQAGALLGSLPYMSPEQAGGEMDLVDQRSDVFGLGAILCCLLTGQPPYVSGQGDKALRLMAVRWETGEAMAKLDASGADPEVVALAKRCLAKNPDDRPKDAQAVADVLTGLRHAAAERVRQAEIGKARAETRRRVQAWSAAVVFAVLSAGVVTAWFLAKQAREAEVKATDRELKAAKARDRTREVLDAMVSDATGDSLATQKEISEEQKKFLQGVLGYYREFAGEKADDELSRRRTASAALKLGQIEGRLGRHEKATDAFQTARGLLTALATDFPDTPEYRKDLAACHNNLGNQLETLGRLEEAEREYRKSLSIRMVLVTGSSASHASRSDLAVCHTNLSVLLATRGKRSESVNEARIAIAIQEKLVVEVPDSIQYRDELSSSYLNLGSIFVQSQQWQAAEREYRKAMLFHETQSPLVSQQPSNRHSLAQIHASLGNVLANLDDPAKAEKELRLALTILDRLANDFAAIPAYRLDLAKNRGSLAILLAGEGRMPEAVAEYRHAQATLERLVSEFRTVPSYRSGLATTHLRLGNLLIANPQNAAAGLGEYRKALTIQKELAEEFPDVPSYRIEQAASHSNIGSILIGQRQLEDAEQEYRIAREIYMKLQANFPELGGVQLEIARNHFNFACLWAARSAQEPSKKQEHADRAVKMFESAIKAGWKDVSETDKEPCLELVRKRSDFKKLRADMEANVSPQKPQANVPPPALKSAGSR